MRKKLLFCLLLTGLLSGLLALCAPGLALSDDYDLFYGGDLNPLDETLSPRSLLTLGETPPEAVPGKDGDPVAAPVPTEDPNLVVFPDARDVRPVGQPLLPTMVYGETFGVDAATRNAGLATGFTTLWGGKIDLTLTRTDDQRTALLGTQALSGAFLPRAAEAAEATWGTIAQASLTNAAIQSLVPAAELPMAGHTVLLANHATLEVLAEAGAVPAVLLETRGQAANLLLDEGSILRLVGPVALSDGPLSTLSLSPSALLEMNYTPTAALPSALPLPMVLTLYEEASLSMTLQNPAPRNAALPPEPPYTPAMLALSSLGQNQISLSPGSTFALTNKTREGRVFAVGIGLAQNVQQNLPGRVQQGVLQIIANRVTLAAGNQKTLWDNGTTPFILSLTYDATGRVLAADTTGYIGTKPSIRGLSLTALTSFSASRGAELEALPEEEEEEKKEEEPFNGWAIGVDYVYIEGGQPIQIPQWGSHSVRWASETGDDVTITAKAFTGFTPTAPQQVVHDVRKHMTYDYVYTRNTTPRTATIMLDITGLDATQQAALRAAAQGTLRLYQDGGYQELPYAMPAGANSLTVSGNAFTHTPSGAPLASTFAMPTPPAGLKVAQQGDVFTLSYVTPPTPPATPVPPVPDVTLPVAYVYSTDNGASFPGTIPGNIIAAGLPTSITVPQGQSLAGNPTLELDLTSYGYTHYTTLGTAQTGQTVTVQYLRETGTLTGTLTLTEAPGQPPLTALPATLAADPDTYFTFTLDGTLPPNTVDVSGPAVTATWNDQPLLAENGAERPMACTPAWGGASAIQMTGHAGSTQLAWYRVTVNHQLDVAGASPFATETGYGGYYMDSVTVTPGTWNGLSSGSPLEGVLGPLQDGTQSQTFTYSRTDTTTVEVKVWFSDSALSDMPTEYNTTVPQPLEVAISAPDGTVLGSVTFPALGYANGPDEADAASGSVDVPTYPLPTDTNQVDAYPAYNAAISTYLPGFPEGNFVLTQGNPVTIVFNDYTPDP